MRIAIRDGEVILQQLTPDQYNTIKAWNLMRWIRAEQALRGKASIDLLDKLSTLGKLPPASRPTGNSYTAMPTSSTGSAERRTPCRWYPTP